VSIFNRALGDVVQLQKGTSDAAVETQLAIEKVGELETRLAAVQTLTQANRADLAHYQTQLESVDAQTEKVARQMSGLTDPLGKLHAELAGIAGGATAAAGALRGIGTAGGGASSGGMKTFDPMLMGAAALEELARAIKPSLDKITARSK
jgi:hypothetical protein